MQYSHNFNPTISDEDIFNEIVKEKEYIGYYNLPFQDTTPFKEYAKTVTQSNVVVIGIGGSTLGTYAIYKYLKHSKNLSKKLFFLETTDPIDIKSKIENIDLEDTLFVVISKSGTTVETVAIFKYVNSLVTCNHTNTVIITESDSKLNTYAQANAMTTFDIPQNVGGRFSVFSAVGLLPLAIVGINIDELLKGAKETNNDFFGIFGTQVSTWAKSSLVRTRLLKKARFLVEYKNSFNINVVFSYSSRLEGFNKWYIQLWGESLGKVDINNTRQGLTPIGIIGPIDQHSFLQLIIEGRRDKTVTVIKVENFDNDLKIPAITLEGLEDLDYLNDLEFSSLIKSQADATIEAIQNLNDIPCDVITIDGVCESAIASLMYEYELLTSLCGKFMYINTYDQPGVESGKMILKKKLQS
ncbi:glucose-6-phosphate isomerase [Sulfurimonas autotrophica]|uniref:Glucose-6-phosphate isomerase n=1 Tax=Sulfurimonas autotrophica (strain ATCC BAA-671 / DSM 16294 / JCM 11897 / OK10) TaxID=563040 RepID=E0UUQ4_SULAO|nr:glucose-6-phosphate isomerase [Sulfurimonas autotrophica]ADN09558.1 glucose-6-phosphate isomerase [Sulfurimonas autotrophica DSM 16294]